MKQSISLFSKMSLMVISLALGLVACSKKDSVDAIPVAAFAGSYLMNDDGDTYIMKVESKGGNKFAVSNFGGFMNVPVEAVAEGTSLRIKSQSFTNAGSGRTIVISGTAVLMTKVNKDDSMKWNYEISGYTSYTGTLEGLRQ